MRQQLDKSALQWIEQLCDRYGVRPGYGDYIVSVLKANDQREWPNIMQTLRELQPGWFK